MKIKATVCELSNEPEYFERDWQALVAHVKSEKSDLVRNKNWFSDLLGIMVQ